MKNFKKIFGGVIFGGLGIIIMFNSISYTYEEDFKPIEFARAEEPAPEPKVVLIEVHPIALNRVSDCESGLRNKDGSAIEGSARHYTEEGTVIIGGYTDPQFGLDIGMYQINTKFHLERAEELGIDIFTEEGNTKYARILYRESGTQSWIASRACWDRM